MKISVIKLTDDNLLRGAVKFVFGRDVKTPLRQWYASEHSPARTQLFAIFSEDTPYSVCMQLRTHDKNGALFLVESGRPDTGSERCKNQSGNYRDQPRNMFILCNAQHLMDWSHKRMCNKAEKATREWFVKLFAQMLEVDKDLTFFLKPMCEYRGGICTEFKPCGRK